MTNLLDDAIKNAAEGPKKVTGDAGSVEQYDLDELIKADRYLASKKAAAGRGIGIKLTKITPDGAD